MKTLLNIIGTHHIILMVVAWVLTAVKAYLMASPLWAKLPKRWATLIANATPDELISVVTAAQRLYASPSDRYTALVTLIGDLGSKYGVSIDVTTIDAGVDWLVKEFNAGKIIRKPIPVPVVIATKSINEASFAGATTGQSQAVTTTAPSDAAPEATTTTDGSANF